MRIRRHRLGPRARSIGWLTLACSVTGCLTTERLMQARDEGEVRCYRAEFDVVWDAIGRSFDRNGLQLEKEELRERYLVARSGPEPEPRDVEDMAVDANAGERVAVFVDSAAPGVWAVQVVSRANFALDPGQKDWTSDLFEGLERVLPDSARRPWHYEYPRCVSRRESTDSIPSGGHVPPGVQPVHPRVLPLSYSPNPGARSTWTLPVSRRSPISTTTV